MSISAMKQALEALENVRIEYDFHGNPADEENKMIEPAITALRQAIAEAEKQEPVAFYGDQPLYAKRVHAIDISQERVDETAKDRHEPVAWMYVNTDGECEQIEYGEPLDDPSITLLYAVPPKREWVGLTDEEVGTLTVFDGLTHIEVPILADFVRDIEAKLKDKNT